jgi:hypothetical protein
LGHDFERGVLETIEAKTKAATDNALLALRRAQAEFYVRDSDERAGRAEAAEGHNAEARANLDAVIREAQAAKRLASEWEGQARHIRRNT